MSTSPFSSSDTAVSATKQARAIETEPGRQKDGYQWTALSVTTVGALLASIQGSALLIALPNIMADLHATFFTIMWVLLGYLLVTTVLTPVVGRLADMWGRKRLYNSGFAVFVLGSLVAGLAQPRFHGADLILGRLIQGVGGALLVTNSTAIVTDAFRKGRVGLGLGINQIAGAAGFLIGPVIGGLLTEWSWRWVFLFNVPLGIFGVIWGIWRLREPVTFAKHQRIDWFGLLTLTIGLTGVLLGLSMLAFPILSPPATNSIIVIGLISLILFAIIEPRIKQPIVQLRLFRNRLFLMANLSGLLNGIARGAVLFLLIFFLQGPYGQDPLRMALMGGGSGFFVSPNTNAIMSSVEPQKRGSAAGILTMLNNTGQMLSIAIVFPLALSAVPMVAMMQVFIYGGGMSQFPAALAIFLHGLHFAFLVSFGISVVAMIVAALRPAH